MKIEEERGEMERELREKESELASTVRSLQAQEHHVRLAEEQVETLLQKNMCTTSICPTKLCLVFCEIAS